MEQRWDAPPLRAPVALPFSTFGGFTLERSLEQLAPHLSNAESLSVAFCPRIQISRSSPPLVADLERPRRRSDARTSFEPAGVARPLGDAAPLQQWSGAPQQALQLKAPAPSPRTLTELDRTTAFAAVEAQLRAEVRSAQNKLRAEQETSAALRRQCERLETTVQHGVQAVLTKEDMLRKLLKASSREDARRDDSLSAAEALRDREAALAAAQRQLDAERTALRVAVAPSGDVDALFRAERERDDALRAAGDARRAAEESRRAAEAKAAEVAEVRSAAAAAEAAAARDRTAAADRIAAALLSQSDATARGRPGRLRRRR